MSVFMARTALEPSKSTYIVIARQLDQVPIMFVTFVTRSDGCCYVSACAHRSLLGVCERMGGLNNMNYRGTPSNAAEKSTNKRIDLKSPRVRSEDRTHGCMRQGTAAWRRPRRENPGVAKLGITVQSQEKMTLVTS
jgi:hypothetical protein